MLKKRIAATLVVRNGIVVQSIGFNKYFPVGKPEIAIEYLNSWGIDEIILLDISATASRGIPNYKLVKDASLKCLVPLAVGGGISKVEHISELMHCGADKISLNQSAIRSPSLITAAAKVFGNQCVVLSIDAIKTAEGYKVYDYIKRAPLNIAPAEFAKKCQELGAGEIMINSVDQDGSYKGYDIDLIHSVCGSVTVPVICCGGAKNAVDIMNVLEKTSVSGASAANFYHFTEHSVNVTKAYVSKHINLRFETFADYKDHPLTENIRLGKKDDQVLEEMLYIKIEKEVI